MNSVHILPHHVCNINFNIILTSTPAYLKWFSSFNIWLT
jgi:hypothetical protein